MLDLVTVAAILIHLNKEITFLCQKQKPSYFLLTDLIKDLYRVGREGGGSVPLYRQPVFTLV